MKNILLSIQEEVNLNCFIPKKFLKEHSSALSSQDYLDLSLEEKLLLVVLDRDGYFYSNVKPEPEFLLLLKKHKIFVQAFRVLGHFDKTYGCFLKSFVLLNPNLQPLRLLK